MTKRESNMTYNILNLSGYQFTNSAVLKHRISNFPGGEVFFKIEDGDRLKKSITEDWILYIYANPKSSDDVMSILLANDCAKTLGWKHIKLFIPYVPYGRQDRVMTPGESLSIKVFSNLINSCGFDEVVITDPHSSVTTALINNIRIDVDILTNFYKNVLANLNLENNKYSLISPDAGAEKRCHSMVENCFYNKDIESFNLPENLRPTNIVVGVKHRDFETGKVSVSLNGQSVEKSAVIVDDICDGGRTFIELSKVLKEHGVERIILIVTHGIFSQGLEVFNGVIDEIYCFNSLSKIKELEEQKPYPYFITGYKPHNILNGVINETL